MLAFLNIALGIINIYLGVKHTEKKNHNTAMMSFIVGGFVIGIGLMTLMMS